MSLSRESESQKLEDRQATHLWLSFPGGSGGFKLSPSGSIRIEPVQYHRLSTTERKSRASRGWQERRPRQTQRSSSSTPSGRCTGLR